LFNTSTFWDHIQELRSRLVKSLIGLAIGSGLAFWQWQRLWGWIARPITSRHLKVTFIATSPMETMATSFKLSLIAGCVLAFPWIMWQAWSFLAPGLHHKERRLFLGTFLSFIVMFLAGAAFCYFMVLPAGLTFLASYMKGTVTQSWKQEDFASFMIRLLLAFGLIFELPVIAFVLGRLGLITARGMWGFFRFAIVIIFVLGAILTPDPISQIMMALPLCLLYVLSIGICALAQKKVSPGV
jgi:sec-independent protein translocase protein TatC